MISEKQLEKEIQIIIQNALREDVGDGDHSSLACIPKDAKGKAKLLIKDRGILAGVEVAEQIFSSVDSALEVEVVMNDGEEMAYGDTAFYVSGSSQSILKAERLVLNTMQRMSAIATKAHQFSSLLSAYKTQVLDTRKTTPGFRALEKMAVKIGGGQNHRFALYDMIMLKDNHIDFAGGITKAIQKTQAYLSQNNLDLKLIVEARSISEVREILESDGVFRILLDNFNYEETREAVALINGKCLTESSGGITLENAKSYAECGVDFISSGALIHSVHNLDLSLKAV